MGQSPDLLSRFRSELVAQVVTTAATAALVLSLTRFLDPDGYGLLFLSVSILSFLTVFAEAGIPSSAARYIAEYKEREPQLVPGILRTSLLYASATASAVAVALVLGHRQLAQQFGVPELAPLLLFGTFFVVFGTLTRYIRVTLQGLEKIGLSAASHVLNVVGRFVIAVGLVVLGYGVWGAVTGYVASFVLVSAFGLAVIYPRLSGRPAPDATDVRRRIGRYAVPLSVTNAAKAIDLHVGAILVGFYLNPLHVSFYVLGKQVSQFVETPAFALGFSLAPAYGAENARGNVQRASTVYQSSLEYTLVVYLPAAAGLFLVAEPAVRLVFGPGYLGAVPVVQILSLYVLFRAMTSVTENGLDYLGRARSVATAKLPSVGLNVLLSVLMIPTIGVTGAAIATVSSYGLFTVLTMYVVHTELIIDVRPFLRTVAAVAAVAATMSLGVALFLRAVDGLPGLVGAVVLGLVVWAALSHVVGLVDARDVWSVLR